MLNYTVTCRILRVRNGGTTRGELILKAKDYREPSTEPSANLVGTKGEATLKKVVLSLMGMIMLVAFSAGSVFASQTDLRKAIDEVVGTPYKWGGTTTEGFDCSGFILYIFKQYDTKLPRTSSSQAKVGTKVDKDDLRLGDLVFFNTNGKGVSHAGVYIGDGQFAHSSSSKGVRINKLSDSYYAKRYVTARRVVFGENYEHMISEAHDSEDDSSVLED